MSKSSHRHRHPSLSRGFYILIGVTTTLLFLIVAAPAATVWSVMDDDMRLAFPRLQVNDISGSIWHGQSRFRYWSLPTLNLAWEVSPWQLLLGRIAVQPRITGSGLVAAGAVERSWGNTSVSIPDAKISSGLINHITSQYGLRLTGEFSVRQFFAEFDPHRLQEVSGEITWSGGLTYIEIAGQTITRNLPPLTGSLSLGTALEQPFEHATGQAQRSKSLILTVTGEGQEMMRISVQPDGWVESALTHEFMRRANIGFFGSAGDMGTGEDKPAFRLKQKVF